MNRRHVVIRMDRHNRELHRRSDAGWLREKLEQAVREARGGQVELDFRGVHGVTPQGMDAIVRLIQEILRRPGNGRLAFSFNNTLRMVTDRARGSINRTGAPIAHHPEPIPRRLHEANYWWKR